MKTSAIERNADLAILLLRIGVGLVFIVAGWGKLTGIAGTQGFFADVGIPLPGLMAWVVAIVEFFGGLMVLLGLYVRIATPFLAIIMVVAILTVGLPRGFMGIRLELMLVLMNLALFILGSGRFSLEAAIASRVRGAPRA